MNKIAVIDYGMGNLRSVEKAIEHVAGRSEVIVTCDPRVVRGADRVVFPGQGAMPDCIRELEARGSTPPCSRPRRASPSWESASASKCFSTTAKRATYRVWACFRGEVRRFPEALMFAADGARLKVPHMGWNEVRQQGARAGMAFPTTPASISCTATTSIRPSGAIVAATGLWPALYQCGGTG